MKRCTLLITVLLGVSSAGLAAQAVPEGSQATKVDRGYRRPSSFRVDPFRHVMIPHWGFVFSVGATSENTALNLADVEALRYLNNNDQILPGDVIDVLGLIPVGQGIQATGTAEGGFYLGGPIGSHVSIGLSAQSRGYGAARVADEAVTLLRDGNLVQQEFDLGDTGGTGLATAELGAHAVLRFGPLGSEDGVHLGLGIGGRLVRAGAYIQAGPSAGSAQRIAATIDSVVTDLEFVRLQTPLSDIGDFTDKFRNGAAGLAADFLVRLEWPTSGLALEAVLANVGSVSISGVARDTAALRIATNNPRDDIPNAFDSLRFMPQDTIDLDVTLPRVLRFSAGAWANKILQVDISATMPVSGTFDTPAIVDIGTTWRFVRHLPLRAGIVLGGLQGQGFTGGFAVEARNVFFQVAAQSLGGFGRSAKGAGARIDFGIFF